MKLDLESERFTPSGGIDGRAARRAMGKPDMQFWELFLRETLQNSWDAKRSDIDQITFSIDAVMFTQDQTALLRRDVFDLVPDTLIQFRSDLSFRRIHALVVSDKGTRGLGGVTRADSAAVPDESRDYVDLLRNVGRASNKKLGGGTYGFGKGVLYDASSIDTCIIYSQTLIHGAIENRLVVSSVSEQFESEGVRFTGRHWWGSAANDGVVDPFTGPGARQMAEALGLARMTLDSTGSVICVLQPKVGEGESLDGIVSQLSNAATHWAWPHTVDIGSGPSIHFSFSAYDKELDRVFPGDDPVMKHYVRAYEKAVDGLGQDLNNTSWPWTVNVVRMLRPKKNLGVLAYRNYVPDDEEDSGEISHHIALMRNPRFVVKYLPIAEDKVGQSTAGVFLAHPDANDDFAKSEPVAHDDWVPQGGRSNPVKVALDKLKAQFRARLSSGAVGSGGEHASGVALVSRMLGSVLSGTGGPGAEIRLGPEKSTKGVSPRNPVVVKMSQNPALVFHNDKLFADFYFKLQIQPGISIAQFSLDASVKVVLDGGAVEDAGDMPNDGRFPEVYGWYANGLLVSDTNSVPVTLMVGDTLVLRVQQPRDLAVTAQIATRGDS